MRSESAPLRVTLSRDSAESEHLVDAVITDPSGIRESFGNADRATIARSSLKPIQVLPLVRSGAADAFDVTKEEIALGAASHSAEQAHTDAVDRWLERIGLDRSALECGPDRPISDDEAERRLRDGESFDAVHNCCSGKHAGFLTVAQHLGHDPAGYINRDHPVQQLVTAAVAEYTGVELSSLTSGIDGCGIPTFALPLDALAMAMTRLVTTEDPHATRVTEALTPNAFWMSGTDRHETVLDAAASEQIITKAGAEGVYMGAVVGSGIGVSLKVRDGAFRAAEIALSGILHHLGIIGSELTSAPITNKAGTFVGTMEVHIQ